MKKPRVSVRLWYIASGHDHCKPGTMVAERINEIGEWGVWYGARCVAKCSNRWMAEAIVKKFSGEPNA